MKLKPYIDLKSLLISLQIIALLINSFEAAESERFENNKIVVTNRSFINYQYIFDIYFLKLSFKYYKFSQRLN